MSDVNTKAHHHEAKADADYAAEKLRLECEKLKAEIDALFHAARQRKWESAERISKIAAAVLIPLLLAFATWVIQLRLATNSANQEYVKVAVSILAAKPDPAQEQLRSWATQVLNEYSRIKMSAPVQQDLNTGKLRLPFVLTDERGNVITDEAGNAITTEQTPNAASTNKAARPR